MAPSSPPISTLPIFILFGRAVAVTSTAILFALALSSSSSSTAFANQHRHRNERHLRLVIGSSAAPPRVPTAAFLSPSSLLCRNDHDWRSRGGVDDDYHRGMFLAPSERTTRWLSRRQSPAATTTLSLASSRSGVGVNADRKSKIDRDAELRKLADQMGVPDLDRDKLLQLLSKRRSKMTMDDPKRGYVDWLLNDEVGGGRKATGGPVAAEPASPTLSASPEEQPKRQRRATTIRRPKRSTVATARATERAADAAQRHAEALSDPTLLTDVSFADRNDLHPATKRAIIENLGLSTMTEIQSRTYAAAVDGKDVLGRARTGTGKTLAFLLPSIERIVRDPTYVPGKTIGVLIVSPTRELASQIGDQAEALLTHHKRTHGLSVQVMYGGTKIARDVNALKKKGMPSVLVATPGRLLDHLSETRIAGRKFGHDIMKETSILVLDETDRLLDMGFRNDIRKILTYLPRKDKRQTLLFSATIPPTLKRIMTEVMKDDYVEVDCIGDGVDGSDDGDAAISDEINARVEQSHVVLPTSGVDRTVCAVAETILLALSDGDDGDDNKNKIVAFFPTARIVGYYANLFQQLIGESTDEGINDVDVVELHSKKSQGYRNKASAKFRAAKRGVLFTSDVSARGVDYPDVTHVIQFGMPDSKENYIHRLGRTARAGKKGKGWLVLSPFESMFLTELKGHDIPVDARLAAMFDEPVAVEVQDMIQPVLDRIGDGDPKLLPSAQMAYQSFLGYYLGQMKRMKMSSKETLVELANSLSSSMGLHEVPPLTKRMVTKMGLKGVSGIVVANALQEEEQHGSRRIPRRSPGHSDGRRAPNKGRRR